VLAGGATILWPLLCMDIPPAGKSADPSGRKIRGCLQKLIENFYVKCKYYRFDESIVSQMP
jgi:hypothetical protein